MTSADRVLRDKAEALVDRGLAAQDAVREAGKALNTLKSKDLWRDTHDSWATYLTARFGLTTRRAAQLIEFADLSEKVAAHADTSGLTERALRPLAGLPDDQVGEAIAEAVAEGLTPASIEKAARKRKGKKKPRVEKPITIKVAGAKIQIIPTHPEPIFRGWVQTLEAALSKLAEQSREAA